jgi:hypothetical protein
MARVWDASSGEEQLRLEGHQDAVFAASFSPDGQVIVTGGEDGTVKLWDASTGTPKPSLEGHSGPVFSVVFSPDGQRILSAGDDQTARLWNATNGALRVIKGHGSRIGSAAFSPDGGESSRLGRGAMFPRPVVYRGRWTIAKVWDADEDQASLTLERPQRFVCSRDFRATVAGWSAGVSTERPECGTWTAEEKGSWWVVTVKPQFDRSPSCPMGNGLSPAALTARRESGTSPVAASFTDLKAMLVTYTRSPPRPTADGSPHRQSDNRVRRFGRCDRSTGVHI